MKIVIMIILISHNIMTDSLIHKALFGDHEIITDEYGVERFKKDDFMCYLVDSKQIDLNKIVHDRVLGIITPGDERNLLKNIGFSVSGYFDCSVNDATNLVDEFGIDEYSNYYGWKNIIESEIFDRNELIELVGEKKYRSLMQKFIFG